MAGEIGQAFVRIRPNTRGFKQEAETGLKGSFTSLAKIAGLAFGAKETFDFVKELSVHASDVQKQIRAVKSEFGDASESVLKFSETGAAALGISAHAADTTAARFGIIFKNLGIGNDVAARSTIEMEQLAGSLALIRNVDPAVILKNLPLAIQGNLRSLKQLGIATDANQLKQVAFSLGLTKTVKEGLTPQTRALAILAVATGHLNEYMAQAGAHAGDAATQNARLAAQWDNAKDKLGKGLLPYVAKLTIFMSQNLPGAVDATIKTFSTLGHIIGPPISGLVKGLGGAKSAVRDLIIVWVAWKAVMGVSKIAVATEKLIVLTKVMRGAEAATKAEAAAASLLRTRLIALGALGAIVVTVIVAEKVAANIKKLQEGEISAKEAPAPVALRSKLVPHLAEQIKAMKAEGAGAKAIALELRAQLGDSLKSRDLIAEAFRFSASSKDASKIEAGWKKALGDPAKKGIKDAGDEIKKQLQGLAKVGDEGAIKAAKAALVELGRSLADAIKQQTKDVTDAVTAAKANLVSIGQSLADAIGQVLDKPFQDEQNRIAARGNRKSLEDLRASALLPGGKTLAKDPKVALAQLEALARSTKSVNRGAIQDFILQYRAALLSVKQDQVNVVKETTSRQIADLTDAAKRGDISPATYKKRILAILTKDHVSYKRAGATLGSAFANGFLDITQGLFDQINQIAATPAKFKGKETNSTVSIVKPLETLHASQETIGKLNREIGNKQIGLQAKIEKHTAKAAANAAKTATLQAQLNKLVINRENAVKTKNPGKASATAAELAGAH